MLAQALLSEAGRAAVLTNRSTTCDIEADHALEECCSAYQGATVFIRHDRTRILRLVLTQPTRIIELASRPASYRFPGNTTSYSRSASSSCSTSKRARTRTSKVHREEEGIRH